MANTKGTTDDTAAMEGQACFENYPLRIVAVANIMNFSIWVIGIYVLSGFGLIVAALYLAYCLAMEYRVLRRSCVNCYYYDKVCFSGLGKVCSLFFKKGKGRLTSDKITWGDIMLDLMVSIFPIVGGIILLLISFSWAVVVSIAVLAVLTTAGNGFVRGRLACTHCKQRELGCPAQQLFEGRGQKDIV